jgi:hypothetical protein
MYQLLIDFMGNPAKSVKRLDADAHLYIPFDPANTDYQEYLAWLEKGNEPLPADENTPEPAEGAE